MLAVEPESSGALLHHIRQKGFERAEIIGEFIHGTNRIKIV